MRSLLFFCFTFFAIFTFADDRDTKCIERSLAKDISLAFKGLYIGKSGNLDEYCESDLGAEQFRVFKVLERIKSATKLGIPKRSEDALSLSHIDEHNWWHYFESRVNSIELPRKGLTSSSCRKNVVAYVTRPQRGTVFICPHFFSNFKINDLVATLIHEARHFDDDGHRHALCNDGAHQGKPACDESIYDRGSYAVGLQVLVRLAQDPENSAFEKYELEARALYKAHANFNQKPEVKITESLVLANKEGDVFQGDIDNLSFKGNIGPHKALAYTRTNIGNSFTLIPDKISEESTRLLPDFSTELPYKLTMQRAYESDGVFNNFLDIDFLSQIPALLTKNEVISDCRSGNIQSIDISDLNPISLINYDTEDGQVNKSIVLSSGKLLDIKCRDKKIAVSESTHTLTENLKDYRLKEIVSQNSFLYGLLGNGRLVEIGVDRNIIYIVNPLTLEGTWHSLTKIERPSIFEK